MAWTTQDLQALEQAIATGARKVKYSDKEVEYRDLDEMYLILSDMKSQLGVGVKRRRYAQPSKGIY